MARLPSCWCTRCVPGAEDRQPCNGISPIGVYRRQEFKGGFFSRKSHPVQYKQGQSQSEKCVRMPNKSAFESEEPQLMTHNPGCFSRTRLDAPADGIGSRQPCWGLRPLCAASQARAQEDPLSKVHVETPEPAPPPNAPNTPKQPPAVEGPAGLSKRAQASASA